MKYIKPEKIFYHINELKLANYILCAVKVIKTDIFSNKTVHFEGLVELQ